jgi:ankyrin repeat protein
MFFLCSPSFFVTFCTPLHYCAVVGFIDGARELLDAGAQINAQTRMIETPLIFALSENQLEMVEFLIEAHAEIDRVGSHHRTPLFYVSDAPSAAVLIQAGANVNFQDDELNTPLHCAAAAGYLDIVELLLANGAQVNASNSRQVLSEVSKHRSM